MKRLETGKKGEEEAVKFLKRNRYKIVERNYRTRFGEIDIIAVKNGELVFIEVKTRNTVEFGYPEEAVSKKKIASIKKVVDYYIQKNKLKSPYRFEVVSILFTKNGKEIKIIPLQY